MKTKMTTWLAQIVAVALMLAAGRASASNGLLSGNSPLGKNALEGGLHRASASVNGETHRGCIEVSRWDAAELFVAPVRPRLPQDINVNPVPPDPLALTRPIGQSATQNAALQAEIAAARRAGATDFRVNQQQVNAAGQRVGTNRPDLQYTDANGRRVYVEYDTSTSTRGPGHQTRIEAN